MSKSAKHTLEELIALTPADAWRSNDAVSWESMPAVGREWPYEGWDESVNEGNAEEDANPLNDK